MSNMQGITILSAIVKITTGRMKMSSLRGAVRRFSMAKGRLETMPSKVQKFIQHGATICTPDNIHICDGSEVENAQLLQTLQQNGMIQKLPKYKNCWLTLTDPADVARVESKTVICTEEKRTTVPIPADGVEGKLGKWISPADMEKSFQERFPGCMKGRTMYVLPFSMGPVGSPLSKIGIQLTDSAYVAASMRIMTRMGSDVLQALNNDEFVRCLHSVGQPLPIQGSLINNWPCNPAKTLVAHIPERNEIASFGSGYGGNSLLGKKCFALRLGSIMAHREGWLAEHMLILGITNPKGQKKYIAAAFPSACGKTNLAMLVPTLPGWKVECVGDDIAWMRFDETGQLRAINPEAGFFGVAPGTSSHTNPNAMSTIQSNTIFTNVAFTSDGGFFWEGLEKEVDLSKVSVTNWKGMTDWQNLTKEARKKDLSAHANSRFCTPAAQCPIMDSNWESPSGVPIEAILFGGRRPEGVPLVYEAFDWNHAMLVGASMRSEATAAAEHQGKMVMHDPFAMRPFFGYNFGDYLKHWLGFGKQQGLKLPKVYHVNWFRKGEDGGYLWPGFGENCRVLDWICRRLDGEDSVVKTPIGNIPAANAISTDGLEVDMDALMSVPKDFWLKEIKEINKYFQEQVDKDLPDEINVELKSLEERLLSN